MVGGLLLVSFSLGLSNFAAGIGIGLSGVDARQRLRVALAFGFFEVLMPIIGVLLGVSAAGLPGSIGRYVGGGLLIATGLYAIWQGRQSSAGGGRRRGQKKLKTTQVLLAAAALSIDNLIVGFALGVRHVPIVVAAAVIAFVSVAMAVVGLQLGDRLGEPLESLSEEVGGAALALVGVALATGSPVSRSTSRLRSR
jgi:manganese efflux pump family protein